MSLFHACKYYTFKKATTKQTETINWTTASAPNAPVTRHGGLSNMDAKSKGFLLLFLFLLTLTLQEVNAKTRLSGRGGIKDDEDEEAEGDDGRGEEGNDGENGGGGGKSDEEHEGGGEHDEAEDAGKGVEAECDGTYALEFTGPVSINAGIEAFCNFTILGSSECQPEVRCNNVDIHGDGSDCEETYLEIADGWGGVHRVCGSGKLSEKGVRASYGARDLFISVAGHPGGVVDCKATCGNGRAIADFLGKAKKRKTDKRCVCGIQNLDDRIVNGEDAKKYEFPWLGAVVDYGTRTPFCGSSLVNDRWILTATHCFWFSKTPPEDIQVLLHAHLLDATILSNVNDEAALGEEGSIKGKGWDKKSLTDEKERTIRLDIDEIIMHPLFTEEYDFDACLLRISVPLDLASVEAAPICLPKVGDVRDFVEQNGTVAGWGLPDENAASTTRLLQKLEMPVIELSECTDMMEFDLTERMLCAGYQEGVQDACTGDSGGPLIVQQGKNQFMQIGIVSWGEGCARENRPGMYSRVTEFSDWLQWHMRKSNPTWCRDSIDSEDD